MVLPKLNERKPPNISNSVLAVKREAILCQSLINYLFKNKIKSTDAFQWEAKRAACPELVSCCEQAEYGEYFTYNQESLQAEVRTLC